LPTDATNQGVHAPRLVALWRGCGWLFVALVVFLSLAPAPPELAPSGAFDAGHVLAYLWLTLWFAQTQRAARQRAILAALLCALGIALEFAQGTTTYRRFEYSDMALNALGIGMGLLLARTRLQNVLRTLERHVAGR
jgi:VanZ family protein